MAPKLWRGCTTYPEVLETARDASKATAEVACGRELCFDRLPRAVGLLHLGGAKRDTAVVELSFPSSLLGKGSALANHPLRGQGRRPVSYEIELKLAVP